jgi:hypothetical protein
MPPYSTRSGRSAEDRFWRRVDRSGGPDACWRWLGSFSRSYGFWERTTAHRYAYCLLNGPLGDELSVLHRCPGGSNRWCVNPAHLYPGTDLDNAHDRDAEGRTARGERHWTRHKPERLARGERNARWTHPERTARGDQHWTRLHPERCLRGEKHGNAKLTWEQVRAIRQRAASGERNAALGREYGVSKVLIGLIVRNLAWKEDTDN